MKNKNGELQPGQLVSSTQGRDYDRFYLVYDRLDDNFVRVVDGEIRKIEAPKKKNIRHLQAYDQVAVTLAEQFKRRAKSDNAEVRRVIAALTGLIQKGTLLMGKEVE